MSALLVEGADSGGNRLFHKMIELQFESEFTF